MSLGEAIFRFVGLLAAVVAGGGFVLLQVAIVPTFRRLSERDGIQVHQAVHDEVHPYMPLSVGITGAADIVVLVLRHDFARADVLLTAIGVLGVVAVAAISQLGNTPINNAVASWSLDAIPRDAGPLRERWMRFQLIRTLIFLPAAALFIAAALLR